MGEPRFVFPGKVPSKASHVGRCPTCTLPLPCARHATLGLARARAEPTVVGSEMSWRQENDGAKAVPRFRDSGGSVKAAAALTVAAFTPRGAPSCTKKKSRETVTVKGGESEETSASALSELDTMFDGMATRMQSRILAMRAHNDARLMEVAKSRG
eukprot:TRINITY_DN58062_c0_g1_i1.p1 TRINITY_DN58062_c0_g1~~TRINITY_DN58062_c0_g1_i1.p1  ORF type:complete len:156 (+),score=18.98 TRINITY_DN58062_c0_g1_i1:96-563(+)